MKKHAVVGLVCIMALTLSAWMCTGLPSWVARAEAAVPILTQQAANIANLADPSGADATLVAKIAGKVVALVDRFRGAVDAYNKEPNASRLTRVADVAADVTANLSADLDVASIKDKDTRTSVGVAVASLATTIEIIATFIPPPPSASKAARAARKKPTRKIPSPQELRDDWNARVCGAGSPCQRM